MPIYGIQYSTVYLSNIFLHIIASAISNQWHHPITIISDVQVFRVKWLLARQIMFRFPHGAKKRKEKERAREIWKGLSSGT